MTILILYLIANAAVSLFLEKSRYKMRIATVLHAVTFIFVLAVFLISQFGGGGFLSFLPFYDAMVGADVFAISPLLIAQLTVPILISMISAFAAIKVIRLVEAKICRTKRTVKAPKRLFHLPPEKPEIVNRIYLLNCVIRC